VANCVTLQVEAAHILEVSTSTSNGLYSTLLISVVGSWSSLPGKQRDFVGEQKRIKVGYSP